MLMLLRRSPCWATALHEWRQSQPNLKYSHMSRFVISSHDRLGIGCCINTLMSTVHNQATPQAPVIALVASSKCNHSRMFKQCSELLCRHMLAGSDLLQLVHVFMLNIHRAYVRHRCNTSALCCLQSSMPSYCNLHLRDAPLPETHPAQTG